MWQNIAVTLILVAAVGFLVRRLYRQLTRKEGCSCAFCPTNQAEKNSSKAPDCGGKD